MKFGNRKIVAWTGLQYPWKYRSVSEEFKAKIKSTDLPPFAEGMREEAMKAFFGALSCTLPYGYDMENDYRENFLFFRVFFYFALLYFIVDH
jgi:hypothetical protein